MLLDTKQKFYEMQRKGLFNIPRYWDTLDEVDTEGTLTARNTKTKASKTYYFKTLDQMRRIFANRSTRDYVFLENPPDQLRSIQGEFTRLNGLIYFKYNQAHGPLGTTLPNDYTVITGIKALQVLRHYLDSASFEDLFLISDVFGDLYNVETPVVEFSSFTIPVGQMVGRNTIIWEVRSY